MKDGNFVLVNRWARKFSVGDVVTSELQHGFVIVKRIRKVSGGKFLLAGDSQRSAKPVWIKKEMVKGRLVYRL